MNYYDLIIVGGGLAGLTAAIHLKQAGFNILLVEKNEYPNHKVCGEYVSNEVKGYLKSLGVPLDKIPYADINTLELSTHHGDSITTKLPLGGFGISRYALDQQLYETAQKEGVVFVFDLATSINFIENQFTVKTSKNHEFQSKWVIGAHGKRSIIDKSLDRDFVNRKSAWLGVKCHYELDNFPNDVVALHNFNGGYGGLSKTENGLVNFCYLATYDSFKKYKDVHEFNSQVVSRNPHLERFLQHAKPVFKKPISIAQISFDKKAPVENHIIMCGDSAGLIHPLCGNGMAMAIHSAKIAADCFIAYHTKSRHLLEQRYSKAWKKEFTSRLWMGRQLQHVLMNETRSKIALKTLTKSKKLLQFMIKRTHGKPILV